MTTTPMEMTSITIMLEGLLVLERKRRNVRSLGLISLALLSLRINWIKLPAVWVEEISTRVTMGSIKSQITMTPERCLSNKWWWQPEVNSEMKPLYKPLISQNHAETHPKAQSTFQYKTLTAILPKKKTWQSTRTKEERAPMATISSTISPEFLLKKWQKASKDLKNTLLRMTMSCLYQMTLTIQWRSVLAPTTHMRACWYSKRLSIWSRNETLMTKASCLTDSQSVAARAVKAVTKPSAASISEMELARLSKTILGMGASLGQLVKARWAAMAYFWTKMPIYKVEAINSL